MHDGNTVRVFHFFPSLILNGCCYHIEAKRMGHFMSYGSRQVCRLFIIRQDISLLRPPSICTSLAVRTHKLSYADYTVGCIIQFFPVINYEFFLARRYHLQFCKIIDPVQFFPLLQRLHPIVGRDGFSLFKSNRSRICVALLGLPSDENLCRHRVLCTGTQHIRPILHPMNDTLLRLCRMVIGNHVLAFVVQKINKQYTGRFLVLICNVHKIHIKHAAPATGNNKLCSFCRTRYDRAAKPQENRNC